MFGFSFAELILVFLVAIIFIKPEDLPEIAHFFGRLYYKARILINTFKQNLKEMEKDFGLEEIKHELNRGIAAEKIHIENALLDEKKEIMQIIDLYGNQHEVNISELPNNLAKEEIIQEIAKNNKLNQEKTKTNNA